jgi:hypothetical protein
MHLYVSWLALLRILQVPDSWKNLSIQTSIDSFVTFKLHSF